MDTSGSFTLEKVTLKATGELTIYGTVIVGLGLARFQRPRYEVGIHRLGGDGVQWIPANITDSSAKGFSVKASFESSTEQKLADYSDFYFRRTGDAAQDAQRIYVHDEGAGWTAYPTKYRNLSFKRGSV